MDNFKRYFGAIPSPKDERDYPLAMSAKVSGLVTLPPKYECIRQRVLNQGNIGSCVGHAFASAVESAMYHDRGYSIPMSAGSIYQNRSAEHWQGEGMYPRNACEILLKKGIVPEREFSYNEAYTKADKHRFKASPRFRIARYISLYNLEEIKRFVYEADCYVPITIWVFSGDLHLNKDNSLHYNTAWGSRSDSSHEVCIIGYDDTYTNLDGSKGRLIAQNSWGTSWGDGGYFYIPYNVFYCFFVEAQGIEADYEVYLEHEIGTKNARFCGEDLQLPIESYLAGAGYTMYPLRHLNETFGYEVEWDKSRPSMCKITAKIREE